MELSNHTITIPNLTDFNKRKYCTTWCEFIQCNLSVNVICNRIIVDWNKVDFISPIGIVLLSCLLETYIKKGHEIKFVGGNETLNKFLSKIKYKEYWTHKYDRESFTHSDNFSTDSPWKISQNNIESYADNSKKFYEKTIGKDKDLIPIALNLKEIFNNIFDHSASPIGGYVVAQYFSTRQQITYAVCDLGKGIPRGINEYNRSNNLAEIDDRLALKQSLIEGFSIKSTPQNRGMGLSNILDVTESSNGALIIVSNNGYLEKHSQKPMELKLTDINFKGTLITFSVDVSTFDVKDNSEREFDF